jgi:hypothetical protein
MVRLVLAVFALLAVVAAPAFGLADHTGWPPREPGMLLMNKTDSTRPLDARPGHDPFGGRDSSYSCDELGRRPSGSCGPRFERADGGYVVTNREGHNRLLGGHGNDRIHAAPWGDVIWGDYKPTNQTTRQRDHLYGGAGPDFIYASHGRNVIKSGPGSDVIHALYGHGTIDCGKGRDALYLPAKKGAYKLKNCEWKKKRFGESAPKWFINKLPWPITNE